jgi:two-component system, OmpR family, heavy metal sensor histidine kinase CusS
MMVFRHNSLTFRLTLLIAIASTLVLLALGILIGQSVERHFEEQDIEVLNGKTQLAQHALEKVHTSGDLVALRELLQDALVGHHGLSMEVVGPDGTVLFATQGVDFPALLLKPDTVTAKEIRPTKWIARDGTPFRGTAAHARTGIPTAGPAVIAVATDITHHEHYMSSFRMTLWSFMVLAAIAMGVFGWVAVRRGLAPLQSIRTQAEAITARRLNERLPVDAVPAELADLARTLNDMLARLETSFQRLSDFSSDLAHELRTPVSNLMTETQVTLGKARTTEQYRDVLASNAEELERLSRMISDMLFLAKADNDLMVPHQESFDLQDEVRSLLDYYEALAEDADVRMRCIGIGFIHGDRLMLRRAISNLLSNAIRHTPANGEILVRLDADTAGELCLTVENTGDTIPEEHLPRLFDRFYRADASRQRSSEGAGLGLAITQSIVRAHGGAASVRSSAGKTIFELRFPVNVPA